jgi:hemerythrin-like domain-containing protein
LGRRIARILFSNLKAWKKDGTDLKEPVARFLKSYAVFLSDHTGKEDTFFDICSKKSSLSKEEDEKLMSHFESCISHAGGIARIDQMMKLIQYLETRQWIK